MKRLNISIHVLNIAEIFVDPYLNYGGEIMVGRYNLGNVRETQQCIPILSLYR